MAKGSSSIDAPGIGELSRGAIRRRPADFVDGLRSRRRSRSSGQPIFDATSFGIDAAMLALAAAASVISAPAATLQTDAFSLAVFSVLVLAVFVYLGLYRFSFATHFLEDVRTIIAATAIVAMCMTFGRVLIFDNPDAAAQAVRAWIFASTYVIAVRAGRHIVEMRRRREGIVGQRTLIVGAGAVGRQFADRLMHRPEFGLRPVAFLDDDPLEFDDEEAFPIPVLDSQPVERDGTRFFGPGLQGALEDLQVSHVVVSFSTSSHQAELDLLRRCQARGVTVSVLPRLFEGVTDDLELERIGGIPIVSVRPSASGVRASAIRRSGARLAEVPEQCRHGHQDDLEVEPRRAVLDVVVVPFDPVGDRGVAAQPLDLRPAGDPGLDPMAVRVAIDGLVEELHVGRPLRARADE